MTTVLHLRHVPTVHTALVRSWRQGSRAFIAVNGSETIAADLTRLHQGAPHYETYGFFPDEGTGFLGDKWHGQFAGDSRAVMAPILALRALGGTSFKWMLYGDDDTIWFLPAVLELVKNYDPELPHAITDRVFFCSCLPCYYDLDAPPRGDVTGRGVPVYPVPLPEDKVRRMAANSSHPRLACPYCTAELACHGAPLSNRTMGKEEGTCHGGALYGGSGALLSIGLVRRLDYDFMLKCLMGKRDVKGSDRILAMCLHDSGFGFTDPGAMAAHGGDERYRLFMPGWPHGDSISNDLALIPLVKSRCNSLCLYRAWNQVSTHAKARGSPGPAIAAAYILGIARTHQAALEFLALLEEEKKAMTNATALNEWRRRKLRGRGGRGRRGRRLRRQRSSEGAGEEGAQGERGSSSSWWADHITGGGILPHSSSSGRGIRAGCGPGE